MRTLVWRWAQTAAWVLLALGLIVIALNPGVPSVRYAILWAGIMAAARGSAALVPWVAGAVDLSLLFVCFFGLEIGGQIIAPSILAFFAADLLAPERRRDSGRQA